MNKNFWKAASTRAVRTFFQSFVAVVGTAMFLSDVNWIQVLSASALSAILSLATSIATGLPEATEAMIVANHKDSEVD